MVVAPVDRDLYKILKEILADVHVPDLFPAALATAAMDTLDALNRVTSVDRGFIDPPLPGASYSQSFGMNAARVLQDHRDRDPMRLALMGCSGSKHGRDGQKTQTGIETGLDAPVGGVDDSSRRTENPDRD